MKKLFQEILRAFGLVTIARHRAVCDRLNAIIDAAEASAFELAPHERALVEELRERREVATKEWTKEERAAVAAMLKSPAGELLIAEMRQYAVDRLRGAVNAAPGSEVRRLGFAHGVETAAEVLASLNEFHAEEPGEQGSDHADARA